MTLGNTSCFASTSACVLARCTYNIHKRNSRRKKVVVPGSGGAKKRVLMRPAIRPSEILQKRLEMIKSLLGPGWLGAAWCERHSNGITSTDISVDSWRNAERTYDEVATRLIRGLDRTKAFLFGNGHGEGAVLEETVVPADVPAKVVQILRTGLRIRAAGMETHCRIDGYNLLQCIVPFLAYLYCLHDQRLSLAGEDRPARCLATLAAVPGAGKSVLAASLEGFSRLLGTHPKIQVVGMDGWHYPNEVLRGRRMRDESGRDVSLGSRKGSPESFDLQGLVRSLDQLREEAGSVALPVYDRNLHEPVAGAAVVDAPIVLIEGNYLLMAGAGWEQVEQKVDAGVWLEVPLDLARHSIVSRHKDLGRSEEEAQAKWRDNDWPNSLAAMRGRGHCDAVIYEDSRRRQRFVQRVTGGG